ncbi:MAG: hypothetical protein HY795_14610 [Desulfovibrio sp.]|nr:hypothetical protein [Desulfovibrio sp.]MBI4961001.1 hypothetical protein [Desulfovibrio sp.]
MNTKSIRFLLFILLVLAGNAVASEPDGFRGLKWGSPIPSHFIKIIPAQNNHWYRNPNEKMYINGVIIKDVTYQYYKNRLLTIAVEGYPDDKGKLLAEIGKQYGKYSEKYNDDDEDVYNWYFPTVNITYRPKTKLRNSAKLFSELIITYRPLLKEHQKEFPSGF